MSYIGIVNEQGAITLPPEAQLSPGVKVRVDVISPQPAKSETPIGKKLLALISKAKGLPADMALNHDHSLHGTPKGSK